MCVSELKKKKKKKKQFQLPPKKMWCLLLCDSSGSLLPNDLSPEHFWVAFSLNLEALSLNREEEWREHRGLYGKQVPVDFITQFHAQATST